MSKIEANQLLARRMVQAMNSGQLDLLDEVMTPDLVRHCPATPQLEIRSLAQFKDFLRQFASSFPDNVQTFHRMVADEEQVAVWATYEGTHLGAMGPIPATGKRVCFVFATHMRIERGRIAELWTIWDNVDILTQLGQASAQ